jgi:hypothetical protein
MKMTKEDIRILKSKHRLELVMQETGESFDADAANPDQWHGTMTPGLTVDIHRQLYEIKRPGMDTEAGDVLAWLQRRYAWTFGMAIKFLQKRPPDPKQETQPAKIAKAKKDILPDEWKIIDHVYINPATGVTSYAWSYNEDIMDDLQKDAVKIAEDWPLKYFSMSSKEIWFELEYYPHRFKQIVDFDIEKCACCETPFNWQVAGMFACAQEESKYLDEFVSGDISAEEPLFVDADFVICEKCLRTKYAPRYKALRLVWRSARNREEAEHQEQKKRDHEAWVEAEREREREEERLNYENGKPPSVIARRGGRHDAFYLLIFPKQKNSLNSLFPGVLPYAYGHAKKAFPWASWASCVIWLAGWVCQCVMCVSFNTHHTHKRDPCHEQYRTLQTDKDHFR